VEWYVYIINNPRRTGERFVVIDGLSPSHDARVKMQLKDDEFIDEVNTLDGRLHGRADVLPCLLCQHCTCPCVHCADCGDTPPAASTTT
jgi:hypothetical protein